MLPSKIFKTSPKDCLLGQHIEEKIWFLYEVFRLEVQVTRRRQNGLLHLLKTIF